MSITDKRLTETKEQLMKLTTEDRAALQGAIRVLAVILQQAPPEVPERVEEWPDNDTHLRGEFWEDKDGDIFRFSDGRWEGWQPATRQWMGVLGHLYNVWAPFTRTTDPSIPRTWDTLDAVDTDVECVTGDYAGVRRELARGELSESGWFQRSKDDPFSGWLELPADRTKYVKNIREDQS